MSEKCTLKNGYSGKGYVMYILPQSKIYFLNFYGNIVDLQYCIHFRYTVQWYSYICLFTCIMYSILFHYRSLQDIDYISLCYTVGPCWLSVLCICCCSVARSCSTFCSPMDCSMPGFPVLHCLPEFTQILVHCVDVAIQPSHPLSPLLLLPSIFPSVRVISNDHLFPSGGQSIWAPTSASVLSMNIQGWFPLGLIGLIFVQLKALSRVFSSTTV